MKHLIVLLTCCLPIGLAAQPSSAPATTTPDTPHLIHFTPTSFSNLFTIHREPVLRLHSGDTVRTETVDAFGRDRHGIRRQTGGNPLTGPFYIDNALPGDVLAITLHGVSLNRPYATTSQAFVSRSMPDSVIRQLDKRLPLVRWHLDLQNHLGWPDSASDTYDRLKNFKVALKPFLGCIGVAPDNKKEEILSFFQGPFGGNLDYSRMTQGVTLYLPVFHPGAYLYMGDAHAVQGDGEISGNALETSMDVTFSVRLISSSRLRLSYPRAEDAEYLMTIGTHKDMQKALKIASAGMLNWLQQEYHVTLHEATQVMSTTMEYTIAEIADPEIVVVAKIRKEALANLPRSPLLP